MKTTVTFFILFVSSVFFTGIANFPVGSLYAASRPMTARSTDLGTALDKEGLNHDKKQKSEIRQGKGKGFFKSLIAYAKWKKEMRAEKKGEPGKGAMIALVAGVGLTLLGLIPGLSFMLLLGLLSLITATALGKYAKNNSTGKDQRMGEISRKIAIGMLIFWLVMAIIGFILITIWLATIF